MSNEPNLIFSYWPKSFYYHIIFIRFEKRQFGNKTNSVGWCLTKYNSKYMPVTITRVFDLLQFNLEQFPKEEFINGKIEGAWKNYSTQAFYDIVNNLSKGLIRLGLGKESRIAVMSHNRPEWNITDFGIMQIGAYQFLCIPHWQNTILNLYWRMPGSIWSL